MASFAIALPFFFLLVLFSSLQIEARQRLFFSKVTHNNRNEPEIPVTEDPATPTPTPTYTPTYAPTYTPTYAPAPAPELTLGGAPEEGTLPVPVPAPAPAPMDMESELGYDLYGYADQEMRTPTTIDVQNEIVTQDNGRYENTNLYNDNNEYVTNYKSDRYTNKYINGREGFTNSYYNGNGNRLDGVVEQQGMSDTRFLENGSYYQDDVRNENNDKVNGYQSGRGSTTNEGYFGNSEKPNEFNTMEEYENYQESQGYVP